MSDYVRSATLRPTKARAVGAVDWLDDIYERFYDYLTPAEHSWLGALSNVMRDIADGSRQKIDR